MDKSCDKKKTQKITVWSLCTLRFLTSERLERRSRTEKYFTLALRFCCFSSLMLHTRSSSAQLTELHSSVDFSFIHFSSSSFHVHHAITKIPEIFQMKDFWESLEKRKIFENFLLVLSIEKNFHVRKSLFSHSSLSRVGGQTWIVAILESFFSSYRKSYCIFCLVSCLCWKWIP